MGDARLGILLTADATQAKQGLNDFNTTLEKTEAELVQVSQAAGKASAVFVQLPKPIQEAGGAANSAAKSFSQLQKQVSFFGGGVKPFVTAFDGMVPSLDNAGKSLAKIIPLQKRAGQATLDLGRIIQDAPYAILSRNISAVANNIDQSVLSFGRLFKEAGGLTNGIKALGKSLVGGAGIGLGISLVTSALTLFGDKLFGSSKAAKELADSNKKLAESLAADAAKLTVLVGIIQNVNTSQDDRAKALQAVNEQYAQYLPNLNLEKISLENIQAAYDGIIDSMLRQAVVKGIQDEIAKSVEETAKQIIALQRVEETRRIKQEQTNKQQDVVISSVEQAGKALQRNSQIVSDATGSLTVHNAEQNAFIAATNTMEERVASLTAQLKTQLAPLLNLTANFEDLDIKLSKVKEKAKDVSINLPDTKIATERLTLIPTGRPEVDLSGVSIPELTIPFRPRIDETDTKFLEETGKRMFTKLGASFGEVFSEIFTRKVEESIAKNPFDIGGAFNRAAVDVGFLEQGISALSTNFNSFVDAIANGANVFQSFGQLVKGILKQVAAELIKTAFLAAILSFLTGGKGAGGLSFGQAFGKIFGGFRAGGGPVSPDKSFVVGENGPEIFIPKVPGTIVPNNRMSNISGMMQVMQVVVTGQISGRNIDILGARQNDYNRRNT